MQLIIKRSLNVTAVLFLLSAALLATPAMAQNTQPKPASSGIHWEGWGPRVGLSVNPDQAWGGVHFNLGYFAPNVRFRPTVEMGFGDDVTLVQALAEAHYIFSKVQVWKPYVGGGLGISWARFDDGDDHETDTEVSFAGVGGVETKLRSGATFGFEAKVGFGDNDPDFKFGVQWSF